MGKCLAHVVAARGTALQRCARVLERFNYYFHMCSCLLQVWRASGTLSTVYPQDSPRATARESVMDRRAGPARQNWPATKAVAQLRSEHFEGQSSASRMFRCRGCDGGRQSGTAGGARALTTLRSLRRQPVCNRESGTLLLWTIAQMQFVLAGPPLPCKNALLREVPCSTRLLCRSC